MRGKLRMWVGYQYQIQIQIILWLINFSLNRPFPLKWVCNIAQLHQKYPNLCSYRQYMNIAPEQPVAPNSPIPISPISSPPFSTRKPQIWDKSPNFPAQSRSIANMGQQNVQNNLDRCVQDRSPLNNKSQIVMSSIEKATEFKNLGNEAFKNKQYEEAIKYFTQAIECNPNDHTFFSNRSGSYANSGQYQKALEDANACIKLKPTWGKGYQRKGTALFYLNQPTEAIEAYKEGLKHDPDNQQIKADMKMVEGSKKQRAQSLLQAYMKLANNPQTKNLIANQDFMKKLQIIMQNPAAMAMFANDPQIKKAYEVISAPDTTNFDFQEFLRGMEKNDPHFGTNDDKMEEQHSPQKDNPTPPPHKTESPKKPQPKPQIDAAEQAKLEGNNEYKKKNFQKAIECYQKAIELKPTEPLYYSNMATAYLELAEYAKAHQELDKADKIFEQGLKDYVKRGKVLAKRGSLYARQGKYSESIEAYEKSLIEDGSQKVKEELKLVKKLKKQKDDKEYINPELAEKSCEEGNTLYKQGKFPAALKLYEQAIKRNPEVAKYYSNLGTAYIKLMEWNRAKESFDIAIKKDPSYIKAYPKKGDCHFAMKEYHKALETYEAGLKIDSANELCKEGLMKTQRAIYTSGSATTEEEKMERAKRGMADPEIKKILQTPEVMNALQDLQNNPAAIQNIMKNPDLALKIEKLIQAGIIGTT